MTELIAGLFALWVLLSVVAVYQAANFLSEPYDIDDTKEPFFTEEEYGDRVGPEFESEDVSIRQPDENFEF
jgi:hypothetical protein